MRNRKRKVFRFAIYEMAIKFNLYYHHFYLQAEVSQLREQLADLRAASAKLTEAEAQLAAQRRQLESLEAANRALESARTAAAAEADDLRPRAERVQELEDVQRELVATINSQAAQVEQLSKSEAAAKAAAADATDRRALDTKAIARLERLLDNYRRVEAVFEKRTGQGFFGVAGAAAELLKEQEYEPASASTSAAANNKARDADGTRPSPLSAYLERLTASVQAETRAAVAAEAAAAQVQILYIFEVFLIHSTHAARSG
jgi:DNA repair exonuclease SbcCD ATPase subunit